MPGMFSIPFMPGMPFISPICIPGMPSIPFMPCMPSALPFPMSIPSIPSILPSCAPRICQSPIPIRPIMACMLDVEANLLSASNRKLAEVTIRSPSLSPSSTSTESWLLRPSLTGYGI